MSQTAKVLLLYAHPESQDSVANRVLLEPALQLPNVTVHDLYAHYPDFFIDIAYEQDLLRQENDTFIRPAPSSRQYVLLILLARSVTQTLQRFYMAIALLLNAGQNALTAEELENLCTVMAQRLSILHGLNAPEFFDKSLFRHFIQTLLDLRVLRKDEAGKLSYHELLGELAEGAAKRVLPAEIRLSIRQVALERPAEEAAAESNDAAAN